MCKKMLLTCGHVTFANGIFSIEEQPEKKLTNGGKSKLGKDHGRCHLSSTGYLSEFSFSNYCCVTITKENEQASRYIFHFFLLIFISILIFSFSFFFLLWKIDSHRQARDNGKGKEEGPDYDVDERPARKAIKSNCLGLAPTPFYPQGTRMVA